MGGNLIYLGFFGPGPQFWERPIWAFTSTQPSQVHEGRLSPLVPVLDPTITEFNYAGSWSSDPCTLNTFVPSLKLLSLPRTCRRVYSECIDVLYQYNSFDMTVNASHTLEYRLRPHMLPRRLECIRSVRLQIPYWEEMLYSAPPSSSPPEEALHSLLELLPGLRELMTGGSLFCGNISQRIHRPTHSKELAAGSSRANMRQARTP